MIENKNQTLFRATKHAIHGVKLLLQERSSKGDFIGVACCWSALVLPAWGVYEHHFYAITAASCCGKLKFFDRTSMRLFDV